MRRSCLWYRWVLWIVLSSALTGCVSVYPSQPSRFYILSPQAQMNPPQKAEAGKPSIAIGLDPVEIPEYINRAQIVTRQSANEIKLWEFDRWAEPLNENFTRVISENLSRLLCCLENPILIYPWRVAVRLDYKVAIGVIRFDGALGKDVTLIVLWGIFGNGGDKPLVTRRSEYIEPAADPGHEALVAAQSRAVSRLSRDIAEAFAPILKRKERSAASENYDREAKPGRGA